MALDNRLVVFNEQGEPVDYDILASDVKFLPDGKDLPTKLDELEDEIGQGGYAPPEGGIPKTDLAQSVQDSLDKADSALQDEDVAEVAKTGDYNDLENKPTIPDTSNLATKTELNAKQDKISAGNGIVIGNDGKTVSVDAEVVQPATADGTFAVRIGGNTYTINLNHSHPQYLQAQSLKAGSNVSLSVNQQTGEVTISATGGSGGGGISGITMNGDAVPVGSNGVVDLGTVITSLAGYVLSSALAAVATSGSYNDLSNKPDLSGLVNIGKIVNAKDNSVKRLWIGTQAEFDEVEEYDADVLYLIAAASVCSIDLDLYDATVPANTPTRVEMGSQFSVTVTPDTNMTFARISGTMAGGTLTKTTNQDGSVTFSTNSVTGRITISASATTSKIANAGGKLSLMAANTFKDVAANNCTTEHGSYFAPQGANKWDARACLLLNSFFAAYDCYNESSESTYQLMAWARTYYFAHINSDGTFNDGNSSVSYAASNGLADHVAPGYNLFRVMELDSQQYNRYNGFAGVLYNQVKNNQGKLDYGTVHPYTQRVSNAHQTILEVSHSIEPFMALYAREKLTGQTQANEYANIIARLNEIGDATYDSTTKLYRHGYAETGSGVVWAENGATGRSHYAFGRALGQYIWAIEQVLDIIPSTVTGWNTLKGKLQDLMNDLLSVTGRDSTTGLWRMIPTEDGTNTGNYLESASSALFAYGYLHGIRKGYLDESNKATAKHIYEAVAQQFATISGTSVTVTDSVKGGRVGTSSTTDAASSLADYYSNGAPAQSGEAYGTAAFILASIEYERMFIND